MFELFEDLLGFEEVTESTDTLFRAELKHHQKSDSTNSTTSLAYDTFQKLKFLPYIIVIFAAWHQQHKYYFIVVVSYSDR